MIAAGLYQHNSWNWYNLFRQAYLEQQGSRMFYLLSRVGAQKRIRPGEYQAEREHETC